MCLVARSAGEIVGYLAGYVKDGTSLRPVKVAELESMYVRGEYRALGLGGRLMERFMQWAGVQEAERVSVTAYAANSRAIRFHERSGFQPKSLSLEAAVD